MHIEPKAMELLVYLAKRQGEVVTREDIEKDVWGGTLVSYDSITSTVIKLRKALQDNAREPDFIATIPKRGYELIASVTEREDPGTHEGTQSIGLQHTKNGLRSFCRFPAPRPSLPEKMLYKTLLVEAADDRILPPVQKTFFISILGLELDILTSACAKIEHVAQQ